MSPSLNQQLFPATWWPHDASSCDITGRYRPLRGHLGPVLLVGLAPSAEEPSHHGPGCTWEHASHWQRRHVKPVGTDSQASDGQRHVDRSAHTLSLAPPVPRSATRRSRWGPTRCARPAPAPNTKPDLPRLRAGPLENPPSTDIPDPAPRPGAVIQAFRGNGKRTECIPSPGGPPKPWAPTSPRK